MALSESRHIISPARRAMSSVLQDWPRLPRGHLWGSNHLTVAHHIAARDRAEGEDGNGNVF
jgi:hypothetical protein